MEKNLKKNIYIYISDKESEKEYIYIYIYMTESLCCTPETNRIL